jgi:hypothetical protein
VLGSRQPPIVGSPEQVADQLIASVEEADVDGFNLSRTVVPECLESFIDLVVPILQERGAYKRGYAPGTYRQKLFGKGDRLPDMHPAAAALDGAEMTRAGIGVPRRPLDTRRSSILAVTPEPPWRISSCHREGE